MFDIADVGGSSCYISFDRHDVRYIGALPGRYALSRNKSGGNGQVAVYACRLRSISTHMAVVMGPVVGKVGDVVVAHFDQLGLVHGKIARKLPSGFAIDLVLTDIERHKLGARISWHKKHAMGILPERRARKRIIPRDPRSVITLADGAQLPCFVIDLSPVGVAVSADIWPDLGTPMAIGKLVGRVVRNLDVGFALQFIREQEMDTLEALIAPPSTQ